MGMLLVGTGLLDEVTSGISTVIGWVASVVSALIGTGTGEGQLSTLAPLFAIGIAISAILLGVKLVKSIVWGA